jgi:hypothetical protein
MTDDATKYNSAIGHSGAGIRVLRPFTQAPGQVDPMELRIDLGPGDELRYTLDLEKSRRPNP